MTPSASSPDIMNRRTGDAEAGSEIDDPLPTRSDIPHVAFREDVPPVLLASGIGAVIVAIGLILEMRPVVQVVGRAVVSIAVAVANDLARRTRPEKSPGDDPVDSNGPTVASTVVETDLEIAAAGTAWTQNPKRAGVADLTSITDFVARVTHNWSP
jgi:membrane protein implicated in regulation of membrane protease activity